MSLGVPRREYSLASKVLHWLMPWHVPVYDSFVRRALGVPVSWDHPQAHRTVAAEVFALAGTMVEDSAWIGFLEPRSPLRALDKLTWWLGGGSTGDAAEVRDPWQVPANSASNALDTSRHAARAVGAPGGPPRGQVVEPGRSVTEREGSELPAIRNRRMSAATGRLTGRHATPERSFGAGYPVRREGRRTDPAVQGRG